MRAIAYKKILVPLDGSEYSERAVQYAKTIAKKHGSEIVLFLVYPLEGLPELKKVHYLNKLAHQLQIMGVTVYPVTAFGNPADRIVNFSEEEDFDLIVMSTHGHGGVSRWAAGSVTRKVMHECNVPLLLIKAMSMTSEVDKINKTLVPLDGSAYSEECISYAAGIAEGSDSEITLLRVNETAELPALVLSGLVPDWEMHHQRVVVAAQKGIHRYLETIMQVVGSTGVNARWESTAGKAADEIIKYAESNDIGLVAISTHGESGFGHWAFGSVANKVVESVSKPTLIIRPMPTVLDPAT
ncbi:MAG: universal stress protein [Chloroflexi bacterium]|nr:universal stress protein [Chloroflexota bacterium]